MGFPELPFTLSDDAALIRWAKSRKRFAFLRKETQSRLHSLSDESPLTRQRPSLEDLWPLILTDALRSLKANDPREVAPARSSSAAARDMTLFHEASLGVKELRDVFTAFSLSEGTIRIQKALPKLSPPLPR
jgi:hypothetical protein